MKINISHMGPLNETAYLTAQNTVLYRTIMRILYDEKEKFNSQLSEEYIYNRLKEHCEFEDCDIEKVKSAMSQLTAWGSVLPMQDLKKVSTIEEYKNKIYKYSLTERAVKIERMTIELENMFTETNTISSSLLVRINDAVCTIENIIIKNDHKAINEWWKNLQEDFKRLDRNFSDYLHSFYSVSGHKMMTSIDFILHKDKFVEYLRDFIQVLQRNSSLIENNLIRINSTLKEKMLCMVVSSEMELPRTNTGKIDKEYIEDMVRGQWNSLYNWFVSENGRESTSNMAMEYTDEIIRKILNNAVMLMQLQNAGISRKQDYNKFMKMFAECDDINKAHCLSAHVFGVMNTSHYKFNSLAQTDSIYDNASAVSPQVFEIKPRTRTYKPKIKTDGFISKASQKAEGREARLAAIREEQKMIESYIENNMIKISELSKQTVPEKLRITLLKWITAASQNKNYTGITDFGRKYRIRRGEEMIVLHCDDGDLYMPEYIFEFEVKSYE